jgi:hypothetical protein
MQNPFDSSFFDDDTAQDDVDMLFSHLQHVASPPGLIARILSQVPSQEHGLSHSKKRQTIPLPPLVQLENLDCKFVSSRGRGSSYISLYSRK